MISDDRARSLGFVPSSQIAPTTVHSDLSEALIGAVVPPGDPGWDDARSSFNLLLDQRPAAVAFPVDERDVAAAVTYARRNGLRVAPQATGHNQGPLGNVDGMLLLNVSALQEVEVDPGAKQVRVGAGVKWERVAPRLSAHGLAGLHGSSPDVGIAGYSLGGGMGWLARKYGLQTNAVTAFELVTAEGKLVRADAESHVDLFWALRGGGGNFGVVTAIEFGVHEVEQLYAGAMFFPFERASEVLHTWRALLPVLPDELMSWAALLHFPPISDIHELGHRKVTSPGRLLPPHEKHDEGHYPECEKDRMDDRPARNRDDEEDDSDDQEHGQTFPWISRTRASA